MRDKFICDCELHSLSLDTDPIEELDFIGITIYEHRSGKTGKQYKKPKELGTVVLIGKEAKRFKERLNEKTKD